MSVLRSISHWIAGLSGFFVELKGGVYWKYAFALILVALLFLVRHALQPWLGADAPLLVFLLSVILSSWLGGVGPGIFSTLAGGLLGVYFFIQPNHSFDVILTSDRLRIFLFGLEGVIFSFTMGITISSLKREVAMGKKLEASNRDLATAKEVAENAVRSKSLFLANVTHEIRTPLGAILGYNDLLLDPQISEQEKQQFLAIIQRNSSYLSKLVDDFLDLSRAEAGELELEILKVPIRELLTDVMDLLALKARSKGLELKLEVSPAFPAYVKTDPTRLRQIVMNVVGNAIKFTTNGWVKIQASWKNGEGNALSGMVEILVEDTGVGIPEDHQQQMFQPYSQGDGATFRRFGGTGLGLYLSQILARELDGDVRLVRSSPNKGSSFLILITTTRTTPPLQAPNIIEQNNLDLRGTRVLIVDDIIDNRTLLGQVLRQMNCQVAFADDGQKGVAKAMAGNYDVVLMDIQMPVMDGTMATRQLRSMGFQPPIIALTAFASNEARLKALDAGCSNYLTKPYSPQIIYHAIQAALNNKL